MRMGTPRAPALLVVLILVCAITSCFAQGIFGGPGGRQQRLPPQPWRGGQQPGAFGQPAIQLLPQGVVAVASGDGGGDSTGGGNPAAESSWTPSPSPVPQATPAPQLPSPSPTPQATPAWQPQPESSPQPSPTATPTPHTQPEAPPTVAWPPTAAATAPAAGAQPPMSSGGPSRQPPAVAPVSSPQATAHAPALSGLPAIITAQLRLEGPGLSPFDATKQAAAAAALQEVLGGELQSATVNPAVSPGATAGRRLAADAGPGVEVTAVLELKNAGQMAAAQDALRQAAAHGMLAAAMARHGLPVMAATLLSAQPGAPGAAAARGPASTPPQAVPPAPTIPAASAGGSSAPLAQVVGIAVGVAVVALAACVAAWCCLRRRARRVGACAMAPAACTGASPLYTLGTPYLPTLGQRSRRPGATAAGPGPRGAGLPPLDEESPPGENSPARERSPRRLVPPRSPDKPSPKRSPPPKALQQRFEIAADAAKNSPEPLGQDEARQACVSQSGRATPGGRSSDLGRHGAYSGASTPGQRMRRLGSSDSAVSDRIQAAIDALRLHGDELASVADTDEDPPEVLERPGPSPSLVPGPLRVGSAATNLPPRQRCEAAAAQLNAFVAGLRKGPREQAPAIIAGLLRRQERRGRLATSGAGRSSILQLNVAMQYLTENPSFAGRYALDRARFNGEPSITAAGRAAGSGARVALKFFVSAVGFAHEREFHARVAGQPFFAGVLDVFEAGEVSLAGGVTNPACIVVAAGNHSLDAWLTKVQPLPPAREAKVALVGLLEAVAALHGLGMCHRDVHAGALAWFDDAPCAAGGWRLAGSGAWAPAGADAPVHPPRLAAAAPEVVAADALGVASRMRRCADAGNLTLAAASKAPEVTGGATTAPADPASDVWGAGVVAWELLTGRALFGACYSDADVAAMLIGLKALPFEADPSLWVLFRDSQSAQLVQGMLARRPSQRMSAAEALAAAQAIAV